MSVFFSERKKKMHPVVKITAFAGKILLFAIVLLYIAWLATLDYFYVAYGLPEALTFLALSVTFLVLIYGMRRHSSYHTYDPEDNSEGDRG